MSQELDKLINKYKSAPENLLQILVEIQHEFKHISATACEYLAHELALPLSHIKTVIDFYSFLSAKPHENYRFLFSDNIVDNIHGSRKLARRLESKLESTTNYSIGYTSCIGMSDQAPAALLNEMVLTNLTVKRIDIIAGLVKAKEPLEQWPTELFIVKNNIRQTDIMFADTYQAGRALKLAMKMGQNDIINHLEQSGLRGRGGAGFNTALKWRLCLEAAGTEKVVVCNADEGEPGTFKDRVLMQKFADRLLEGMTICALAIDARTGFIYLRGEYRYLLPTLKAELKKRQDNNLLGKTILGNPDFNFDIKIHLGAGAYICGEETALLESLEGKPGIPRSKPPFPVTVGYLGNPTVVNNVETFVAAANIMEIGVAAYKAQGSKSSPGTKLISVSGDCKKPGIYELGFDTTINEVLKLAEASDAMVVQVSGAAGIILSSDEFNRRLAYEDLAAGGSLMIFNTSRDIIKIIANFVEFFRHESCGFCTPCRVGTTILGKRMDKISKARATQTDLAVIKSMADTMQKMSHCGLGATAASSLVQSIEKFPANFKAKLRHTSFEPAFDLDLALTEARKITGRDDPSAHLEGGGV